MNKAASADRATALIDLALTSGERNSLDRVLSKIEPEDLLGAAFLTQARRRGRIPTVIFLATLWVENDIDRAEAAVILAAYRSMAGRAIRPELVDLVGASDVLTGTIRRLLGEADLPPFAERALSPDVATAFEMALDFGRADVAQAILTGAVGNRINPAEASTLVGILAERFDTLPRQTDWQAVLACLEHLVDTLDAELQAANSDRLSLIRASALHHAGRNLESAELALRIEGNLQHRGLAVAAKAFCFAGEYDRAIAALDRFVGIRCLSDSSASDDLDLAGSLAGAAPSEDFDQARAGTALADLQRILASAGVEPFLISGTLLGYARNGGFLAHDKDIDVGVFGWLQQFEIADVIIKSKRFTFDFNTLRGERTNVIALRHVVTGVCIDLFFFRMEEGLAVTGIDFDWGFTEKFGLKPFTLRKIEFCGVDFHVPSDIDDFLENHYGPDWRIPDKDYMAVLECPTILDRGGLIHMLLSRLMIARALMEEKPAMMRRALSFLYDNRDNARGISPALRDDLQHWLERRTIPA